MTYTKYLVAYMPNLPYKLTEDVKSGFSASMTSEDSNLYNLDHVIYNYKQGTQIEQGWAVELQKMVDDGIEYVEL